MIANAIGVIVAYVPEGLPLALSMGLTLIARRLCYQHSVLLKRMGTIETMGSMSLLASDKVRTDNHPVWIAKYSTLGLLS